MLQARAWLVTDRSLLVELGAERSESGELLLGALLELLHHLAPLQLEVIADLLSVPLRFHTLGLRFKCGGGAEALT